MRVLYVAQNFSGPSGNFGLRPYENARRLVQMGHEVTVLCGVSDRASEEDFLMARLAGVDIVQAPIRYGQKLSYLRRLVKFKEFMNWAYKTSKDLPKPDVVFATSPPLTGGDVGRMIAQYHKVPFVFETRDLWPEEAVSIGALKNPIMRWMAYRMAARVYGAADRVVALSPDMKDAIIEWGVAPENIAVIPNCSDTHLFGSKEFRDSEREARGWQDKFVCIHPGAMGVANGLDYLLDCAKVLDQRGITDIHIPLVGPGSQRERLIQRIRDEGIRAASIYNPIPRRDMPSLLSAADVGLVCFIPRPHLEKNSANKFFDYLAQGLPVVINYGGWQQEVLSKSGAGLSVDPHNPASLADVLIEIRDNPELCRQMGAAGRRLAEDKYDRRMLVNQFEAVLRSTVEEEVELPIAA